MLINIDSIKKTKGIGTIKLRDIINQHHKDTLKYIPIYNENIKIREGLNLGNAYELIKGIPSDSIDLVIIDPPYELDFHGGKTSNYFYKNPDSTKNSIKEISDGFDLNLFLDFERVMKKMNMYVFCSNKQISKIMRWGEDRGYITNLLVWHKPDAPPFNNGVYISDLEFIVHVRDYNTTFKKGHSKLYTHNKINKHHPTEKPINLISKFIENSSNKDDVVLDCFMGSGTTGIACINTNRKFIGIELDENYYNIAKQRINQNTNGLK